MTVQLSPVESSIKHMEHSLTTWFGLACVSMRSMSTVCSGYQAAAHVHAGFGMPLGLPEGAVHNSRSPEKKFVDNEGFDPSTSRMLSVRSTN